jgi:Ribonuclease G/E
VELPNILSLFTKKYRLSWAALLARVYQIEIETCPNCGGRMKIMAALTEPSSVRRYLEDVGLSAKIPEISPARAPPQLEMDTADGDYADQD